ncbi:alpha-N-acetylgalactosaminide alpha-2,6-sialyltransferase 1-like [Nematolebias whitei]|uniref:alpha-N-acetylgalactosaminide alpha-2,6-sialyltransferase 1-like n=1 Tax=Nematolebias whitei TaxID=451745 RepID=UPI00189BBBA9|nr:alpha-N-acetylgalactosaminide alpha-2,6-sialyltransferase 1-like [Nematolebias whitei]
MAALSIKLFYLLMVILASILLLILTQASLPRNLSWTDFTDYTQSRRQDIKVFWEKLGKSNQTTQRGLVTTTGPMNTTTPAPETPIPIMLKKSFKKLPEWDFEDIYNQDAPPRPTTCVQSLHNSKDEDFQKAFLPNVRLYLNRDNFNMSEWNRLSHFNNPFGFMQMKHDEVMAAIKLLPKVKEPLLLPKPGGDGCVHCAVVGTGGILNGSKMGAEIDAHDYVFRMNGAVIKGFEEDVGNKTSVYVHTAHSITASLIIFRKYGYKAAPHDEGIKYVIIPEGLRDFQWLQAVYKGERVASGEYKNRNARTYYSGQFNESRFYVLHQDFMRYVRNRFLKSNNLNKRYWAMVRPTNGAFALFLALHVCDTVSAYGFITEDHKKFSNYYFERYTKTHIIFFSNHDYIMEKNLWKTFHDKKILKLFQRTKSEERTEKPTQP